MSWCNRQIFVLCVLFLAIIVALYLFYQSRLLSQEIHRPSTLNVFRREIRILCFGDSLTVGHMDQWADYHPYTKKLQQLFDENATLQGLGVKVVLRNRGRNGETLQWGMKKRLPQYLEDSKYHWVILLGGTNDLSILFHHKNASFPWKNTDATSIFKDLKSLHELANSKGLKTVAVTIPERLCELQPRCKDIRQARVDINNMIRTMAGESEGEIVLADVAKKIALPEAKRYWASREIHFTGDGYDEMAKVIYEALKETLVNN